MAKIALRAYNREIESLIERGQNQEAIAHCRHVLKYFPKCIDTYRLLGKAFLESQRYSEAADILQRILSVVPDDFVSQIGNSIIREDEGNLDAAIYHMERAFEVQPANSAIQEELRRLYGRRDGVEPPRVRLTRGALVRMYARGELYRQAIAEARAAIAEDSKRIDLEVILAQMYYQSGQKVEATEICGRLVSKLPYCLVANQILGEILPTTSRAEDAKLFIQRIQSLDPYHAYISQNAPTSDLVPEQAVSLDHLEYRAEEQAAQEPDWAKSVGIQLLEDKTSAENVPDWLGALTDDQQPAPQIPGEPAQRLPQVSTTKFLTSEPDLPEAEKAEIPDWMSAAGWGSSTGEAQESAPVFDLPESESAAAESEIVPGEIPDWLAGSAPAAAISAETPEDETRLDWLNTILPESPQEEISAPPTLEPESANIPDWLSGMDLDAPSSPIDTLPTSSILPDEPTETSQAVPAEEEALPNWLSPSPNEPFTAQEGAGADEYLPDWLKETTEPEPLSSSPSAGSTGVTGWLDSLDTRETSATESVQPLAVEEPTPSEIPATAEVEEISTPTEIEAPSAVSASTQPDMNNIDAAMAWLESLAVKQGASEALTTTPEERQEAVAPPDWVQKEIEASGAQEETLADALPYDQQESIPLSEEIPAASSEIPLEIATPLATQAIPAATQLEQIISEGAAQTTDQPIGSAEAAIPQGEMDADAAFAWLESLAAKQGATEALILNPEDRSETPPEWVTEAAEAAESSEAQAQAAIPDLEELPQAVEEIEPLAMPETVEITLPQAAVEPLVASEFIEPALPLAKVDETADTEIIIPEPQTAPPAAPEAAIPQGEMDADAAFAWLESLAAKQGATEALILNPEDRSETPPEWVTEAAEAAESSEAQAQAAIPDLEELPQPVEEIEPLAMPETVEITLPQAAVEPLVASEFIEPALPLAKVDETADTEIIIPEPQTAPPAAPEAAIPQGEMDADAAFAWLESLAAKQGATEALILNPEDRSENPPEWVTEAVEEAADAPVSMIEANEPKPEENQSQGLLSESIMEQPETTFIAAQEPEPPAEIFEAEPIRILPEEPQPETSAEQPSIEAAEFEKNDLPDWLQNIAMPEESSLTGEETTPETWLKEFESPQAAPITPPAAEISTPRQTVSIPEPPDRHPVIQARPKKTVKRNEPTAEALETLGNARQALTSGNLGIALEHYNHLIQKGDLLDETINDLQEALYRYPIDISIWMTIGDAYARDDRLQEALDAYTKAEELLR